MKLFKIWFESLTTLNCVKENVTFMLTKTAKCAWCPKKKPICEICTPQKMEVINCKGYWIHLCGTLVFLGFIFCCFSHLRESEEVTWTDDYPELTQQTNLASSAVLNVVAVWCQDGTIRSILLVCFIFFDDVNTSHFGEKKCYSICYSKKQGVLMRKKLKIVVPQEWRYFVGKGRKMSKKWLHALAMLNCSVW